MTTHSTNGLAKSWLQSINTLMILGVAGMIGFCWNLLIENSHRLIRVEARQQMVLEEHVVFRQEFMELRREVENLKILNHTKP